MDTRREGEREFVLRALSTKSGNILIKYLALLRHVYVAIMKAQNWHVNVISAYETRLLARRSLQKGSSGLWDTKHVVSAWHSCSEPFFDAKLSIVDMRQITTGIFRKLFPFLLKPQQSSKTAIDGQGDHGAEMAKKHYGRTQDLRHGQNDLDSAEYILASRLYQALMQTEPLDPNWPREVLDSPGLHAFKNTELASSTANQLIESEYALRAKTSSENKALLSELLQTLPFLFLPAVSVIFHQRL